jgi:hypothetical protein
MGSLNSHLDHCFNPSTLGRVQIRGPFVFAIPRSSRPRTSTAFSATGTRDTLAAGRYIFRAVSDRAPTDLHACPTCAGKGAVPGRLPFRTKPCDQCGGRGVVTPIRRQQLLTKLKAKAQA